MTLKKELTKFEMKLVDFLNRECKASQLTLTDLKDIIWNEDSSSVMSRLVFAIVEDNPDVEIEKVMDMIQVAWNRFPHKALNGLSPQEMSERIDEDPEFESTDRINFFSFFDGQFPEEVQITRTDDTDWAWEFPAKMQSAREKFLAMVEDAEEIEDLALDEEDAEEGVGIAGGMALMVAESLVAESPFYFEAVEFLAEQAYQDDNLDEALTLLNTSIIEARKIFPSEFKLGTDRLPWGFLDNRPFLKLLAAHASLVYSVHGPEKSLRLYEELLALNPNDNQGIRSYIATAYLKTEKLDKVIELAEKYPNDHMVSLGVGAILALYKQGKKDEAREKIKATKELYGHVYKEILKNTHPQPELTPGRVLSGGDDEAWLYWHDQGTLWMATPGARDFLREGL